MLKSLQSLGAYLILSDYCIAFVKMTMPMSLRARLTRHWHYHRLDCVGDWVSSSQASAAMSGSRGLEPQQPGPEFITAGARAGCVMADSNRWLMDSYYMIIEENIFNDIFCLPMIMVTSFYNHQRPHLTQFQTKFAKVSLYWTSCQFFSYLWTVRQCNVILCASRVFKSAVY